MARCAVRAACSGATFRATAVHCEHLPPAITRYLLSVLSASRRRQRRSLIVDAAICRGFNAIWPCQRDAGSALNTYITRAGRSQRDIPATLTTYEIQTPPDGSP